MELAAAFLNRIGNPGPLGGALAVKKMSAKVLKQEDGLRVLDVAAVHDAIDSPFPKNRQGLFHCMVPAMGVTKNGQFHGGSLPNYHAPIHRPRGRSLVERSHF